MLSCSVIIFCLLLKVPVSVQKELWIDSTTKYRDKLDHSVFDVCYDTLFAKHRVSTSDVSFESPFEFYPGDYPSNTRDNCYIISLRQGTPPEILSLLINLLNATSGQTKSRYKSLVDGILTCFPENELPFSLLTEIPWISIVERDQVFHSAQIQPDAPWGLSRISKPTLPPDRIFGFDVTGNTTSIYILDSGIIASHEEFQPSGRAELIFSVFEERGCPIGEDCDGHGTQVASIAAGLEIGVAKASKIYAVQVLDCDGRGTTSDITRGMEVIMDHLKDKSVINMSFSGPRSKILDNIFAQVIERSIIVMAAGNDGLDSCTSLASSHPKVITVGASNILDKRSEFSNHGKCIDIFAPGEDLIVASKKGYARESGTSLSASHVSGVLALLYDLYPTYTPLEIKDYLFSLAKRDVLDPSTLYESPNILLQAPEYDENDLDVLIPLKPLNEFHSDAPMINFTVLSILIAFVTLAM